MEYLVMIVDDTGMIRETARTFLRHTEVDVVTARDGIEAMNLAAVRHPSLIYVDMLMPRMSGPDFCRAVRSRQWGREIPLILMLSPQDQDQRADAEAANPDAIVAKPLDRREFLETGRRFLPVIDRREPRVPCDTLFAFEGEGFRGEAHSLDLSVGGAYLITPVKVPRETILTLTFSLPGNDSLSFTTMGRVAWVNHRDTPGLANPHLPAGFGVEFQEIPETVKYSLRKYVESRRQAKG